MANVRISDLPDAITPLDTTTTFFEVQAIENGIDVSRRVRGDMITFTVFPPPTVEGSIVRGNTTTQLYEETPLVIVGDNTVNSVTIDGESNSGGANTSLTIVASAGSDTSIRYEDGGGTLAYRTFYDASAGEFKFRSATGIPVRFEEGNGTVVMAQFDPVTGQQTLWAGTAGSDVPVMRTVLPASGGLEVDNQSTGAGFERVLTTSDLGGGLPTGNQFDVIFIQTAPDTYAASSQLQVTSTGASFGGMTLGLTGAQVRGRFAGTAGSGGTTQTIVSWADDDGDVTFGDIGFSTTEPDSVDGDSMYYKNRRDSGQMEFIVTDSGSTTRKGLGIDPDTETGLWHPVDGTQVVRTVVAGSGGLEVNNTSTGAGFERVLTTADIGGGAQISGTPANNQLAVWTNSTTIEGDPGLTWDGTNLSIEETTDVNRFFEIFTSVGGLELGILTTSGNARLGQTNATGGFEESWILMTRNGSVALFNNGAQKLATTSTGVDIESGAQVIVNLNSGAGSDSRLRWQENGTDQVDMFHDASANLFRIELQNAGDTFRIEDTSDIAATFVPNGQVGLRNAGTEVARTLAAASGGMEVNNTSTGAGFERVLTTSDLGGGGAQISGTPANNQLAIWTNSTTIEGDSELTWDNVALEITKPSTTDIIQRWYNTTNGGVMMFVEGNDGTAQIYQLSNAGATEDVWITMTRNGSVTLANNNTTRLQTNTGGFDGFGNNFTFDNSSADQLTEVEILNSIGGMQLDVTATTGLGRISQTNSSGTAEDIWIQMTRNGSVELRHNNAATARTATEANGSFEVRVDASPTTFRRVRASAYACGRKTGNQSTTTSTVTAITMDSLLSEFPSTWFSTGSDFTVPDGVTQVKVSGKVHFDGSSSGTFRTAFIAVNGTAVAGQASTGIDNGPFDATADTIVHTATVIVAVTPGDTISLRSNQDTGGNLNVVLGSSITIEAIDHT